MCFLHIVYVWKLSACRVITEHITIVATTAYKKTDVLQTECYSDLCLTFVVGHMKYETLWTHLHNVWGQATQCGSIIFTCYWLWLFDFSVNSDLNAEINWFESWINFFIKYFSWFYKTLPCTCLHGHKKQATLNIWKSEHSKQSGWCTECPSHQNCWRTRHFCKWGYWNNACIIRYRWKHAN